MAKAVRRLAGLTVVLRVSGLGAAARERCTMGRAGRRRPGLRPNGNGGAATVIPMSTAFDRLMRGLRYVLRGASAPSTRGTTPTAPAQGGDRTAYPGDATTLPDTTYAPAPDGNPDPGEIVWTWVPYEEDHSQGKDRPVLVIGREAELARRASADEQGPRPRRPPGAAIRARVGRHRHRGRGTGVAGRARCASTGSCGSTRRVCGARAPCSPATAMTGWSRRRAAHHAERPSPGLARHPHADRARHHEVTGPIRLRVGRVRATRPASPWPTSCWRPGWRG